MSSNGPRPTSDRPENRRPERRPVRRHGVWREFISSTGKSYYFNIKTQENRWDKPDDWPVEPGENHRNRHNGRPGHNGRPQTHPRMGTAGHKRPQPKNLTPSKNLLDEIRLIANQEKTNQNSTADHENRPSHEASHSRQPSHSSTGTPGSNLTPAGFRGGGTGPDTPSNGSVHAAPLKKRWRVTPSKGTTIPPEGEYQKQTTNGLSANSIFNRIQKRHRVDDFKRLIEERPKLPEFEMSDFEALRPFIDNNLISEEVRKLTHGKKYKIYFPIFLEGEVSWWHLTVLCRHYSVVCT